MAYKENDLNFNPEQILLSYERNNNVHVLIGTILLQVGLYDLLKMLNVNVKSIRGSFVGLLSLGYAKNYFSIEELAVITYLTALLFNEYSIMAGGQTDENLGEKSNELSRKLYRVIKYIYDKENKKLNDDAKKFVKYLAGNILKSPTEKSPIIEDVVWLQCGNGTKLRQKNVIQIFDGNHENAVEHLLKNLGRLYLTGNEMSLEELYSKITFPVSRGTPMIGPLVKLNHSRTWPLASWSFDRKRLKGIKSVSINTRIKEWRCITGHVIDGRNLVPATGYLFAVWNVVSEQIGFPLEKMVIAFKNVKFIRALNFPKNGEIILRISVFPFTKRFEVTF